MIKQEEDVLQMCDTDTVGRNTIAGRRKQEDVRRRKHYEEEIRNQEEGSRNLQECGIRNPEEEGKTGGGREEERKGSGGVQVGIYLLCARFPDSLHMEGD